MIKTQRFRIDHNGAVEGVGFRPTLAGRGISDYGLHICPRNIECGVDVIVKGEENDIRRFHRDVKSFKLKPEGVDDYLTDDLEGYEGDIDFNLCSTGLTIEQMSKFVDSAKELTDVTQQGFKRMDANFSELGRKFDGLGEKFDGLGVKFDGLSEQFGELVKVMKESLHQK